MWRNLLASLLSPQGLLASLIFISAAMTFLTTPRREGIAPLSEIDLLVQETMYDYEEVPLVLLDDGGRERTVFRQVLLPHAPENRLEAILAALREYLVEARIWPQALSAPRVFLIELGREPLTVVLDFELEETVPIVSIEAERRLVESIKRTLGHHSRFGRLHVLVGGRSQPTLLGHIALNP